MLNIFAAIVIEDELNAEKTSGCGDGEFIKWALPVSLA